MREVKWEPGLRLLNRFEITELIGWGGMGQVFRAVDTQGSREYAVKTYHGNIFGDRDLVRRFEHEAEMWIRLGRHPHIVQADFVEKHQGRLCVFTEYVEGGDRRRGRSD